MASRALILREGVAPVRDRLLTTLFIAAVLHGMVILGITFGAANGTRNAAPGLEVLIVSEEVPEAERNDSATYLAQRTQLGSGNTKEAIAPRNRASSKFTPGQAGEVDGTSRSAEGNANGSLDERVLSTTAPQPDIRYFTAVNFDSATSDKPLLIEERVADPAPNDEQGPEQLRGPDRDELWITPDSRESIIAPYLDSWRRRVERIGTLNYPTAAKRQGIKASPVLEVAIGADGKLESAVIRRSSGYPDLDQAALQILKLASPFDPFPPDLAREYRRLRFSYEWQFVSGRLERGTVSSMP